jgi:hypothetical protein
MNLQKQNREAMSAWVNPKGDGREAVGFELRFKGKELTMARQIVAFLASEPTQVKKAVLGEPIEYNPRTKEAQA